MNKRQKAGHHVINVARKLFAGTTVQNWKVTSYVYKTVFASMYKQQDIQANFRGLKLTIPTNDITLAPTILSGNFEEKELEIFENLCGKSQVVLDVGANIGLYTTVAARKVGLKGKVYAFEPIAENLKYLEENIRNNELQSRVEIIDKAVGEKAGVLKIFILKNQIGTHSAIHSDSNRESVHVPMCSIDSFIKANHIKKVDIIKVDVEGYDGNVLMGAFRTLKEFKPTLFIEYSPQLLDKSGFGAKDFQEQIFKIYRNCYLVDEFKNKVYPIDKKGLAIAKVVTNVNLIFSDDPKSINKIKVFTSKNLRSV